MNKGSLFRLSGQVAKKPATDFPSGPPNPDPPFISLDMTEPNLGVPAATGYVLTSDTNGVRTWVAGTDADLCAVGGVARQSQGRQGFT